MPPNVKSSCCSWSVSWRSKKHCCPLEVKSGNDSGMRWQETFRKVGGRVCSPLVTAACLPRQQHYPQYQMGNFGDYYKNLLAWEGYKPADVELIAPWDAAESTLIQKDFKQAINTSGIKSRIIPIRPGSTNQSVGNQVASFFVKIINSNLPKYVMRDYSGQGYPDKKLIEKSSQKVFAFELKATSSWNSSDSNRRVLTSSSKRLREKFSASINHILATCCYSDSPGWKLTGLRLDFIEPTAEVDVRLEASVNHKSLSLGTHSHVLL
jgi:hypothetical protein